MPIQKNYHKPGRKHPVGTDVGKNAGFRFNPMGGPSSGIPNFKSTRFGKVNDSGRSKRLNPK